MSPAKFLEVRRPVWQRLEELTGKGRRRLSALREDEIQELARLYPMVAVDTARAKMYGMGEGTRRYINELAIAAHGLLYRRKRSRPLRAVGRFLVRDYPRLFRDMKPYVLLSLAIFMTVSVCAYICVRVNPSTAYLFVPGGLDVSGGPEVTEGDVGERYRTMSGSIMASAITTNNIGVAFYAFALGIAAGIGTCYVLLFNGMMLGGFFGHFANHGLSYECYSFLVPHGALEIFAIIVAGGAGLRLGLSIVLPGRLTRKASLRSGAREAVLLVLGTIPMFIIAGIIESFITPAYISGATKILIGLLALGTTLAWLLMVGREMGATTAALTT